MIEVAKKISNSTVVGIHAIAELTGCNKDLLDDEDFLKSLIERAAVAGGGSVLQTIGHSFEPQGVTAISLLAESHISIHTWPERAYAAVDVFTCGKDCNPELSVAVISKEIQAQQVALKQLPRGERYER